MENRLLIVLLALFLAAAPAEATWVCTPRTVSTRRGDYCLADVMCKSGEVLSGRGSCQFRNCSPYANRPFKDNNDTPVGWRCSGNSERYSERLDATVSITCCKEVQEQMQQPTPPPELSAKQGGQPQPQTQSATKQTEAKQSAVHVSMLGAGQAATLGAIDCADGANEMLKNDKGGSELVGDCMSALAAGKQLEDLANKNGATGKMNADEELLSSDKSKAIFATFEKNFGMTGRDFVQKMVAAGPSRELLSSLLESKISADKLAGSGASSGASSPAAQKPSAPGLAPYALALRDADAKTPKAAPSKRRRDLAADLAEMPETLNDTYMVMGETLTPLKGDPLLEHNGAPQAEAEDVAYDELTLFDIVHRKYVQKTLMLAPRRPGQVPLTPR